MRSRLGRRASESTVEIKVCVLRGGVCNFGGGLWIPRGRRSRLGRRVSKSTVQIKVWVSGLGVKFGR